MPQGSHLGPAPFLVFIDDLAYHVSIFTDLYADDALLQKSYKRCTTAQPTTDTLQTAVNAAEQGAPQWHGRFGHAKTKQLNIEQTHKLPLAVDIKDHQIEEVARHKHFRNQVYTRPEIACAHTRGDWQCCNKSRTSPMNVQLPAWTSRRPLVPCLCSPNNRIHKPPLA